MNRYAVQSFTDEHEIIHAFAGPIERVRWFSSLPTHKGLRRCSADEALRILRKMKTSYYSIVKLHGRMKKTDLPKAIQDVAKWINT